MEAGAVKSEPFFQALRGDKGPEIVKTRHGLGGLLSLNYLRHLTGQICTT